MSPKVVLELLFGLSEAARPVKNFSEIGLNEEIVQSVTDLGFENPTEIQAKVIPEILSSERDVIGLAQTGTGKTAAFGLPIKLTCQTLMCKLWCCVLHENFAYKYLVI